MMEMAIRELVEVISVTNERDWWDYVVAVAPLLLSIIAIVISIGTARVQNKISLFEKRYKIIHLLGFLREATKSMLEYGREDRKVALDCIMSTYETTTVLQETVEKKVDALSFYNRLLFEVGIIGCFFEKEITADVYVFLYAFREYVSNVYMGRAYDNEERKLRNAVEVLDNKEILKKLEKYIKFNSLFS